MQIELRVKTRKHKENGSNILHPAWNIARYYGFNPIKISLQRKSENSKNTHSTEAPRKIHPLSRPIDEKISLLELYASKFRESQGQPALFYFERQGKIETTINLEVIGSGKVISEAILIQTGLSILREHGYKNLVLEMNSMGDKDSMTRSSRALIDHYRNHSNKVSNENRTLFKKDIFTILNTEDNLCPELRENAPNLINFLSENSRLHFKELIEYVEALEIPYRINNNLIGDRSYSCHTVFEIKSVNDGAPEQSLAFGCRYNTLSKKLGAKREIPAVGLSLKLTYPKKALIPARKIKSPTFYLIHMGQGAKLASLKTIERLRKLNITVYHSLTRDKLAAQLAHAETLKTPHLLIIGQRESVDGTIILRNAVSRSQETYRIDSIGERLKRMSA